MIDLRTMIEKPLTPGAPAPAGRGAPMTTAQIWRARLRLWIADLDAACDVDATRPSDLSADEENAVEAARAWVAAGEGAGPAPADVLALVQAAWARLHPGGRTSEAELLDCFLGLVKRVGCPSCGGLQVYDLADACWACGGKKFEARLQRGTGPDGEPIWIDEVVDATTYDIDVRFRCADPKCVQWGTGCSRCGALEVARNGETCRSCRAPWPRTRTRWRTEPKGACAGRDPTSNDPALGCGWKAA